MATLLEVLSYELEKWPDEIDHFFIDWDGEVRGHPEIDHDFYCIREVDEDQKRQRHGRVEVKVTKDQWLAAIKRRADGL